MGDEVDNVLCSFGLSADNAKKCDTVKAKFDRHFVKRKIAERAQSLAAVVGVGGPHHTRNNSVQQRTLCETDAVREVISSQCAEQ